MGTRVASFAPLSSLHLATATSPEVSSLLVCSYSLFFLPSAVQRLSSVPNARCRYQYAEYLQNAEVRHTTCG